MTTYALKCVFSTSTIYWGTGLNDFVLTIDGSDNISWVASITASSSDLTVLKIDDGTDVPYWENWSG